MSFVNSTNVVVINAGSALLRREAVASVSFSDSRVVDSTHSPPAYTSASATPIRDLISSAIDTAGTLIRALITRPMYAASTFITEMHAVIEDLHLFLGNLVEDYYSLMRNTVNGELSQLKICARALKSADAEQTEAVKNPPSASTQPTAPSALRFGPASSRKKSSNSPNPLGQRRRRRRLQQRCHRDRGLVPLHLDLSGNVAGSTSTITIGAHSTEVDNSHGPKATAVVGSPLSYRADPAIGSVVVEAAEVVSTATDGTNQIAETVEDATTEPSQSAVASPGSSVDLAASQTIELTPNPAPRPSRWTRLCAALGVRRLGRETAAAAAEHATASASANNNPKPLNNDDSN
ncbi:hypothetical protein BDK51DRAFT_45224 [Blyttiomyces helicus]|uniref:Uncharacterized protein n=1 Tax=Blyttiomyces helicus TaxID=388810 RepID=A0A4P9WAF0_9FUNG|nr:hypothetical protein BDK51DRAFT_45224 [Blyttiomyces helicus]|eukprot:RKO88128.1 hypothetical protein BDK51DRAFT_45224 [Blyttiomyces helicus]